MLLHGIDTKMLRVYLLGIVLAIDCAFIVIILAGALCPGEYRFWHAFFSDSGSIATK